jgi:hypothetical protein
VGRWEAQAGGANLRFCNLQAWFTEHKYDHTTLTTALATQYWIWHTDEITAGRVEMVCGHGRVGLAWPAWAKVLKWLCLTPVPPLAPPQQLARRA